MKMDKNREGFVFGLMTPDERLTMKKWIQTVKNADYVCFRT
jgi:hypothetical protein